MFIIGMSSDTKIYFSTATVVIAIPTAIKIFNWFFAVCSLRYYTCLSLYIIAFIFLFMFGGFTGVVLANSVIDITMHDSYYVVAHFHYTLSLGATVVAIMYHIFFFFFLFDKDYNELVGKSLCLLFVTGTNVVFFFLHINGAAGQPRRV
jgi:cytochrome c oxidase subunit 1